VRFKNVEVFVFEFFEALQGVAVAFFAACVPFYADVFGICDGSRRKIRRISRNLDERKTYLTLSAIL
jgi:hypothetical protein